MKAIMYGAGNIGRGFIGASFFQAGYAVTFVDVNPLVIEQLNRESAYPVMILDDKKGSYEFQVENVSCVDGKDIAAAAKAIAEADIMATAVGVNVLPFIIPVIAEGVKARFATGKRPLDILICENKLHADAYLREEIAKCLSGGELTYFMEKIGLVETSIGRMVPIQTAEMQNSNPLRVCVEPYCELPVDSAAFKGSLPKMDNLLPYEPFNFYIERKLFIHNMGHALCAYLGALQGMTYIYETIEHTEIELFVLRAMLESGIMLHIRHNIPFIDIKRNVEDLIYRFGNKLLGDTVARVGNDLKRKLSPDDRLIAPLLLTREMGLPNSALCLGIAAAMLFPFDELSKMPPEDILKQHCKLQESDAEWGKILHLYTLLKNKTPLIDILKEMKGSF